MLLRTWEFEAKHFDVHSVYQIIRKTRPSAPMSGQNFRIEFRAALKFCYSKYPGINILRVCSRKIRVGGRNNWELAGARNNVQDSTRGRVSTFRMIPSRLRLVLYKPK